MRVTGYVLIRSAKRWPLDADFKSAARIVSETLTTTPVAADDVHAYLRDVVFGSGSFGGHPLTPLYALAGLLAELKTPRGSDWNDRLDLAEAGIEAAEATREEADPAIVYRYLKK